MSQAPAYVPAESFADSEANNAGGRSTVRTALLDQELTSISTSINALGDNLELIQRDDGNIRDGMVKTYALASDVLALLTTYGATPRGAWLTATSYAIKDLVTQSGNTYMCVSAHTSGTFNTDLAAVKWLLFTVGSATAASAIPFTPTATLAAVNVQAAIEEADTENRALYASVVASGGSALVGFSQGGTGASTTTVQAALRETAISVTRFGAVAGGADNQSAFQACINYCVTNQRAMFIPQGTWNCNSGLSITGKIKIFGEGRYMSLVQFTGTSVTGFTVNTASAVEFHSMWIYGVTPGASNCGISLTGTGSGNFGSVFRDVVFDAFYDPFITLSAYGWTMEDCAFNNWTHNAVAVANALSMDSGDSTITHCLFSNAGASARCVFQSSSGGLRIINCKMNGGAYGYLMDLGSGVVTSILTITGCSIENQTTAGIRMINTSGGGSFSQVVIDGNQFFNQPTPIALNDAAVFILGAVIADNSIVCASGATTTAAITATAVPRVSIDDNVIYGSGTTVLGISIGALSADAQEGNNLIYGCVTAVTNAASNTVASATSITLPLGIDVVQISGTTNITSIAAASARKGRVVTLVFAGILTFTDGSNLKLAGNFVTTADDTITLACADGTNWYEVCRSVN